MKNLLSSLIWIASKLIGRKNLEKLLVYSAKTIHVNLHLHGLIQNGGISSFESRINGEQLFIEEILPDLLSAEHAPIFFDVGANIGDYSLELKKKFLNALIYSFEPVKSTFDILAKNVGDQSGNVHNIGFSDSIGTGKIFNTANGVNNEIASVYKDVFQEIFKREDELRVADFQMDTIDNFCNSRDITHVDFLKIDVEGHELVVLKGAANSLLNKQIKIIQFEFNSHNVYSRVFLRDFYLILPGYKFYRILQNGITKLGSYNHLNEIFALQNIVAI